MVLAVILGLPPSQFLTNLASFSSALLIAGQKK